MRCYCRVCNHHISKNVGDVLTFVPYRGKGGRISRIQPLTWDIIGASLDGTHYYVKRRGKPGEKGIPNTPDRLDYGFVETRVFDHNDTAPIKYIEGTL